MNFIRKIIIFFVMLCFIFSTYSPALSNDYKETEQQAGLWVVWDLALIRPLGVISIGAGMILFVASLPFSLPSKNVKKAGKKLVVEPIKFTFVRPLGSESIE